MTQAPRGYNSPEEYFQALDKKARSRKGVFVTSTTSHHQTRQGRGTIAGRFGSFSGVAVGDSSSYDEAYGPSNRVRRGGFYGGGSFDEGLIARRNSRDAAEETERQASTPPPKKPRKKKK